MARFHLPLASETETVYRSVSMYALAQLIKAANGATPDLSLEGLKNAYAELHRVNRGLAKRIGAATGGDPARNAVALLDAYTTLLPNAIEQALADMRPLFGALLGGES
jgi:hypothetical protein